MSVASALFWLVTFMVLGLAGAVPGLVRGPVSPSVHAYEDRGDQDEHDDHEHPSVRNVTGSVDQDRDTGQHCLAPVK